MFDLDEIIAYWNRRPPIHRMIAARWGFKDPGPEKKAVAAETPGAAVSKGDNLGELLELFPSGRI